MDGAKFLVTDEQFQIVVGLLVTQLARLEEIRDGVNALNQTVEVETTDECPHPEEQRVDISTLNDLNHWICTVCKFDSKQALTKN